MIDTLKNKGVLAFMIIVLALTYVVCANSVKLEEANDQEDLMVLQNN